MERGPARSGPEGLLERSDELERIELILDQTLAGEGSALLIEGPAGIGKTALLDAARLLGARRGMTILTARGGELEGNFPFGVVQQLFEAVVQRASAEARAQLLGGAAGLAVPIFDHRGDGDAIGESFTYLHGLYWLTINLSIGGPLLVVVDDLHWADARSVRFLVYLVARLAGLPIAVIGATRPPETPAGPTVTDRLIADQLVTVIKPAALSPEAVGHLVAEGLDQKPDKAFAAACAAATGGVPFLVLELVAALAADDVEPSAGQAAAVGELGPEAVARATIVRLARMPAGCLPLARAIAVLGGDATLPRARRLADLHESAALEALDSLVGARVVRTNEGLEFVHPILRRAIYDELPPGTRSKMHRDSAGLLANDGARIDAIAAQLMASEPTGSPEVIDQLRQAAQGALARGGPEAAIAYLSRALAEGGERELRARIAFELATAQRLVGDPVMVEHFEEARRTAVDPALRNTAALELASSLSLQGERDRPLALVQRALEDLGDGAPDLGVRLECFAAALTSSDPRLVSEFDQRTAALQELLQRGTSARALALLLAVVFAWRNHGASEVAALVELGWDGGRVLEDGGDLWAVGQGISGLIVTDQLEWAANLVAAVLTDGRSRGSLARVGLSSAYRGLIDVRQGSLAGAESELRAAIDPVRVRSGKFALCTYLWFATDVMLERPEAADLADLTETVELGPLSDVVTGAMLLEARGRLRHAAGGTAAAVEDLERAGAIFGALGLSNPNASSWRSGLALMLPADRHEDALELAMSELEDANRVRYPRAVGISRRAVGVLQGGASGREMLEEAVAVLEPSSARLELARALVELGGARRRAGERVASREPLRAGLDLAVTGGASRLAERARAELAASGAHPRRERITGRDSLTPSELRVAQLAAEGHTNNEIAQALFVTPKTVDTHLSHAYAKLGISSRHKLAAALDREP
jgi:DNA-binding CsgD family transcriptional regulator